VAYNVKNILTGIIIGFICISLNAEKAESNLIYYGTSDIFGKEYLYLFEGTASPVISPNDVKKAVKIKKEAPVEESKITEQKPISGVFHSLPIPSSQSFFQDNSESAVIYPNQRLDKQQSAAKTCLKNTYWTEIISSNIPLHLPEQRQKLSIAATQCGMFTSFASQSPPLPPTP